MEHERVELVRTARRLGETVALLDLADWEERSLTASFCLFSTLKLKHTHIHYSSY